MFPELNNIIDAKKVLILGLGKEGQSSLRVLSRLCKPSILSLADGNEKLANTFQSEYPCYFGKHYLDSLDDYDLIIKSPGIPVNLLKGKVDLNKVRSQTDIFLELYGKQTIGITGTKGKSTSASLLYHLLKKTSRPALLVGNIGWPPFDFLEEIQTETCIVFELSSHQLDGGEFSPHIAIILNLFEEHLDHYGEEQNYYKAKLQIAQHQSQNDFFIYNGDNPDLTALLDPMSFGSQALKFSKNKELNSKAYLSNKGNLILQNDKTNEEIDICDRISLPGNHNLLNSLSVALAAKLSGLNIQEIAEGIKSFKALPHRLEYVGEFGDIRFYDDSISTIPQASIEAIKTLKEVDTLILGGKDRGINYDSLVKFLPRSSVKNIFCMGDAGQRIQKLLNTELRLDQTIILLTTFEEMGSLIRKYTSPGKICLLSPAAPSYDWFANFAERGEAFKKIARNL